MADEEGGHSAEEDGGAGEVGLVCHGLGLLHLAGLTVYRDQTLGSTQSPPDDEVQHQEGEEGDEGGDGDPGPGGVPHDVVLGQSQLGGSDEGLGVVAAVTRREVQAEGDSLRLKELGEVEEESETTRRNDVAKSSFEVTNQPVVIMLHIYPNQQVMTKMVLDIFLDIF